MSIEIGSTKASRPDRVSFLVMGASGVGKTHSTKTLPYKDEEILIADIEQGTMSISDRDFPKYDIDKTKPMSSFNALMDHIEKGAKYKAIVLDSITCFGSDLKDAMMKHEEYKDDTRKMYGDLRTAILSTMERFLNLPVPVRICLAGTITKEDGPIPKDVLDIDGSAKARLPFRFDECYHLITKPGEDGVERFFITQDDGHYQARSRMAGRADSGILPREPADYTGILNKVFGKGDK